MKVYQSSYCFTTKSLLQQYTMTMDGDENEENFQLFIFVMAKKEMRAFQNYHSEYSVTTIVKPN